MVMGEFVGRRNARARFVVPVLIFDVTCTSQPVTRPPKLPNERSPHRGRFIADTTNTDRSREHPLRAAAALADSISLILYQMNSQPNTPVAETPAIRVGEKGKSSGGNKAVLLDKESFLASFYLDDNKGKQDQQSLICHVSSLTHSYRLIECYRSQPVLVKRRADTFPPIQRSQHDDSSYKQLCDWTHGPDSDLNECCKSLQGVGEWCRIFHVRVLEPSPGLGCPWCSFPSASRLSYISAGPAFRKSQGE